MSFLIFQQVKRFTFPYPGDRSEVEAMIAWEKETAKEWLDSLDTARLHWFKCITARATFHQTHTLFLSGRESGEWMWNQAPPSEWDRRWLVQKIETPPIKSYRDILSFPSGVHIFIGSHAKEWMSFGSVLVEAWS